MLAGTSGEQAMDRGHKIEAVAAPSGGDPGLQPAISIHELAEFANTKAAQRLAQLEADTTLMFRLSTEGFEGESWREVYQALIDYGFSVMRAWIVTGLIFTKMAEKGRKVAPPPPRGIPRDDAIELAYDTVADAVVDFRDRVLMKGRWDPSKGANLTTFFIGNCLLFQFPNLYRDWRKQQLRSVRSVSVDGDEDHPAIHLPATDDPAHEVMAADTTRRVIAETLGPIRGETNKAILRLRGEGFGIDEIAETLGLEYEAVESRIYRARQKLGRKKGA